MHRAGSSTNSEEFLGPNLSRSVPRKKHTTECSERDMDKVPEVSRLQRVADTQC